MLGRLFKWGTQCFEYFLLTSVHIRNVINTIVRNEEISLIYSKFAISHSNRKDHKRIRLISQRVQTDRVFSSSWSIWCVETCRSPIVKLPASPSYNLNHRLVTINGFGKICTKAVERCNIHMDSEVQFFCYKIVLGIEFYLFVSHGGMKDRESTCRFCDAGSVFEIYTCIFHNTMRNKKVKFNSYVHIFFKIVPFWLRNVRF